jgi:uncharacterized membrane protein
MTMSPRLRKFTLAVHLTSSVGWLGAAAAYLTLVVVVLTNDDPRTVRDAVGVMELIDWYVIIPLAAAAFITGLVLSVGTPWGLFRHHWVVFSLLLTAFGIFVLVEYSLTLREMAAVASNPTFSGADLDVLKDPGHAVHDAGGLGLLLTVTVLNVYKPRGLTRYGWRKQQERRTVAHSVETGARGGP